TVGADVLYRCSADGTRNGGQVLGAPQTERSAAFYETLPVQSCFCPHPHGVAGGGSHGKPVADRMQERTAEIAGEEDVVASAEYRDAFLPQVRMRGEVAAQVGRSVEFDDAFGAGVHTETVPG